MTNEKRLLRARGICVIIPTFNNEKTIGKVVKETLCFCDDVIVVNDGCTDSTAQIIGEIDNITVVAYSQNRGKGYALQQGFRKALSMGFAYAITLDADGQHKPEDIPLFLKANQEHPGALIIGARPLQGVERSKGSDFANQFSNFWFFVQTGKQLEDTQTGYRLYRVALLMLRAITIQCMAESAAVGNIRILVSVMSLRFLPIRQPLSTCQPLPSLSFQRMVSR